jgi:hypothetical protein
MFSNLRGITLLAPILTTPLAGLRHCLAWPERVQPGCQRSGRKGEFTRPSGGNLDADSGCLYNTLSSRLTVM